MTAVRFTVAAILGALLILGALAQESHGQKPAEQHPAAQSQSLEHQKSGEQAAEKAQGERASGAGRAGEQLAKTSKEAAGEDEHGAFKHSPAVQWIARTTGLSLGAAYWVAVIFNFVIIAALIGWMVKAQVPQMLRNRTAGIQKGLEEARRNSEEAGRRLGDIESRLARLDGEIAGLRIAAEAEAAAEEERIRAAAEEDKRRVVEAAGQEIEAAGRLARRELKAYAAELAVSLAEKRIQVDPKTDRGLVHSFVDQLTGADGGARAKPEGK